MMPGIAAKRRKTRKILKNHNLSLQFFCQLFALIGCAS
jgi:hypothetical protein